MLRYIKLDQTQQIITEFCCSRVIFSHVKIALPDIKLLFDTDFITKTFKKYKRKPGEYTDILDSNCGKCDGYGYYDWVTRMTKTEYEDPIHNRGNMNKPLIVKNENPISVIYLSKRKSFDYALFYYVAEFKPSPITYRCEQCHGIGISLHKSMKLIPLTLDDELPEFEQPIETKNTNLNITRRIKQWYKNLKSKRLLKSLKAHSY